MTAQKKIGKKRELFTSQRGYNVQPLIDAVNGEILSLTPYTKERFPKNHNVINLAYAIKILSAPKA